jgi:regulator of replication initiation timing
MEAVTEYADKKAELEQRIKSLEAEKTSLLSDITAIKERLAEMELERSANALQSEVEALRTEKAALEEKAAEYDAQAGYEIPAGVTGV